MAIVATANLVGITGIARRLVMDGALDEGSAREAMAAATQERRPRGVRRVAIRAAPWTKDDVASASDSQWILHGPCRGQRRVPDPAVADQGVCNRSGSDEEQESECYRRDGDKPTPGL